MGRVTPEMARETAMIREEFVMLAPDTPPDVAEKVAKELGYPYFSHLSNGYPVYKKTERRI